MDYSAEGAAEAVRLSLGRFTGVDQHRGRARGNTLPCLTVGLPAAGENGDLTTSPFQPLQHAGTSIQHRVLVVGMIERGFGG